MFTISLKRKGKKVQALLFRQSSAGHLILVRDGGTASQKETEIQRDQCRDQDPYREAVDRARAMALEGWEVVNHEPPEGIKALALEVTARYQRDQELDEVLPSIKTAVALWQERSTDSDILELVEEPLQRHNLCLRATDPLCGVVVLRLNLDDKLGAITVVHPEMALALMFLQTRLPTLFSVVIADQPLKAAPGGQIREYLRSVEHPEPYMELACKTGLVFNERAAIKPAALTPWF